MIDLAELAITSAAEVKIGMAGKEAFRLSDVAGASTIFAVAQGKKCGRCWMVLPEVGTHAEHDDLCNRCAEALG